MRTAFQKISPFRIKKLITVLFCHKMIGFVNRFCRSPADLIEGVRNEQHAMSQALDFFEEAVHEGLG